MSKFIILVLISSYFFTDIIVGTNTSQSKLLWSKVSETSQLDKFLEESTPVLFFKHSYKCGLSTMVLRDFEKEWDVPVDECKIVFIDIWKNREVSNYLSDITGVRHHSPQVIVMRKGEIIYSETHRNIKASEVKRVL